MKKTEVQVCPDDIHFVAAEKSRKQTKSFVVVRVFRDALRMSVG